MALGQQYGNDPFEDIPASAELRGGGTRNMRVLPAGHYPMSIEITGADTSPNGAPYAEIRWTVLDGPFMGQSIERYMYLTPGKGPNLHFLRGITQRLTGHGTDNRALAVYGVQFTSQDAAERTAEFVGWYASAQPKQRLDLMIQWLCVSEWSGKTAVVELGVELGQEKQSERTGEMYRPQYNRIVALRRMDDPDHGLEWLKSTEYPRLRGVEAQIRSGALR